MVASRVIQLAGEVEVFFRGYEVVKMEAMGTSTPDARWHL